jgi:glycerol-3-phosphate acyltransferase PlsY
MVALGLVLLLLLLVRHRENIVRLWQGTEGKIGQKTKMANGQGVK